MKTMQVVLVSLVLISVSLVMLGAAASYPAGQNWTNYVRIGAYGLQPNNTDKIVADAEASHVFGIEVDNDIPGRYESFVSPEEKLKAIHDVAEKAHRAGNYAFVYIAGTEWRMRTRRRTRWRKNIQTGCRGRSRASRQSSVGVRRFGFGKAMKTFG
jgi:hypothetical protein